MQNVKILRQILDSILSPQILILLKSSPDIYHFLAEYCNFRKNIGPVEDSMNVTNWGELDSHKNSGFRGALALMAALAGKHRTAILGAIP